jgi:hypothetical protein
MSKVETMNEWFENEMYECRKNALDKLATIIHPEFVETIGFHFVCGLIESPQFEKLIEEMDFTQTEIFAIAEDLQGFIFCHGYDLEVAEQEAAYDHFLEGYERDSQNF